MTTEQPKSLAEIQHEQEREHLRKTLQMLKEEGVGEFKGWGFEVKFDPRAGMPAAQLPKNLFEDEETLVDAVDGEKSEAFKRAQDEYKKNLEWSMG